MPCIAPGVIHHQERDSQFVPCGKCPPCLRKRRREWAFRLAYEQKKSDSSHFITLTYDPDNIPRNDLGYPVLVKRDLQLFFKSLRYHSGRELKYYSCAEYGDRSDRPHYHAIIFGLGKDYVRSTDLAWKNGHKYFGTVEPASISYVTKYHMKPTWERDPETDQPPEFSIMSKGLGNGYLTPQMIKYLLQSQQQIIKDQNGKLRLPRYYLKQLENNPYLPNLAFDSWKALSTTKVHEYTQAKELYDTLTELEKTQSKIMQFKTYEKRIQFSSSF